MKDVSAFNVKDLAFVIVRLIIGNAGVVSGITSFTERLLCVVVEYILLEIGVCIESMVELVKMDNNGEVMFDIFMAEPVLFMKEQLPVLHSVSFQGAASVLFENEPSLIKGLSFVVVSVL